MPGEHLENAQLLRADPLLGPIRKARDQVRHHPHAGKLEGLPAQKHPAGPVDRIPNGGPRQELADPDLELGVVEGLAQEVVGPGVEGVHGERLLRDFGDRDDRELRPGGAPGADRVEPVRAAAKAQVDDRQVEGAPAHGVAGRFAARIPLKFVVPERQLKDRPQVGVLDEQ